ncbi:MAG: homoserine O-succinyltransferase [Pseudomonadota bacterium]
MALAVFSGEKKGLRPMPIKIPDDLPARQFLETEGLLVMGESDALRQDVRPLRIALLNLMPQKIKTETQLARLIGSTPLQVELTLLITSSYTPTTVPKQHLLDFYRPWDEVRSEKFDGLIITGAPIEKMPFDEVVYWRELTEILDWSQTNIHQSYNLCWGAQAALYHFYGIPKHTMPAKLFGVFKHHITTPNSTVLRGFNDEFFVPVSRHTETRREDLLPYSGLEILAESEEAGLCLIQDHDHRHLYMFNHLEYDAGTLRDEFNRDLSAGLDIQPPKYYFPNDDPEREPRNFWRSHAHLLMGNWINDLYQTTPYDLNDIGSKKPVTLLVESKSA